MLTTMSKSSSSKKSSLSDKITDILSTAPVNLDPEDDIYEETKARVTTNDSEEETDQVEISKFRKQNVALLEDIDTKYVGKKSSRKSLKESDDEWETEDEGLSTDEGEALDGIPGTQQYATDDDEPTEGDSDSDGQPEDLDSDRQAEDSDQNDEDFKHLSDTNLPLQQKKGNAVRNQLNVWENLLEIRIQLQKCLLTSNKLPQYDVFSELSSHQEFKSAVKATERNISNMLDKFLSLQTLLLKQYGETKTLLKQVNENKKPDSDEEIPSDTEEEKSDSESESDGNIPRKRRKLSDFENEIEIRNDKYKNYRDSVIQKWNDKTRLAVAKNNTVSNSVLQQIEYILSDKNKLLKRTQVKRSEFDVIGKKRTEGHENERESEETDPEIFDDTDFYHQLLRELIEVKSGDVTDPVQMSRQWIALQNLRSKMKRKIDTKATKGRKIRYVVHSKLVNFMAPINESTWTEESKNDLYNSLFGNKVN